MSKEHHDLEILALAHVTKSTKSLDLFLERKITTEHFTYVPDGDSVSYTQGLFNMILKYYEQSGGSLFTSYILDQKLKNKIDKCFEIKNLIEKIKKMKWKTILGSF